MYRFCLGYSSFFVNACKPEELDIAPMPLLCCSPAPCCNIHSFCPKGYPFYGDIVYIAENEAAFAFKRSVHSCLTAPALSVLPWLVSESKFNSPSSLPNARISWPCGSRTQQLVRHIIAGLDITVLVHMYRCSSSHSALSAAKDE